jgi:hypothetical protein
MPPLSAALASHVAGFVVYLPASWDRMVGAQRCLGAIGFNSVLNGRGRVGQLLALRALSTGAVKRTSGVRAANDGYPIRVRRGQKRCY